MRVLWGPMKMPPWLNILSTGADVAGTQCMRLTKRCRHYFELVIANDGLDIGIRK